MIRSRAGRKPGTERRRWRKYMRCHYLNRSAFFYENQLQFWLLRFSPIYHVLTVNDQVFRPSPSVRLVISSGVLRPKSMVFFQGDKLSMVLLVPAAIEGLKKVEDKLPDLDLVSIVKETHKQEIVLKMPKFKIEKTMELTDILKRVSITRVSNENVAIAEGNLQVKEVTKKGSFSLRIWTLPISDDF